MLLKDSYIYQFRSIEVGEVIISGQLLKFSSPISFNDPFDCDIDLLEFDFTELSLEVKSDIQTLNQQFGQDVIDRISQIKIGEIYKRSQIDKINRSSICVFSKKNDNTTMWSHYGNNHEGVSLIFDLECNNPFSDYAIDKFTRGSVDYNNYKSTNYLKNKKEGIKKVFFTKSVDWKYEAEYRFVLLEESSYVKYNKEFLKGVIFGLKVSDEKIARYIKLCKKNGFQNLSFGKFQKEQLELKLVKI